MGTQSGQEITMRDEQSTLAKPYQHLRVGHLTDALLVCDEVLERRGPFLRTFCSRHGWSLEEISRYIRFAVWYHDTGKATGKWQGYIRKEGSGVTHALPSFAVAAATLRLNPNRFEPTPAYAAVLAILAHHTQLYDGVFGEDRNGDLLRFHRTSFLDDHREQFRQNDPDLFSEGWRYPNVSLGQAAKALNRIKKSFNGSLKFKTLYSLMLSILTACDGLASKYYCEREEVGIIKGSLLSREEIRGLQNEFPFFNSSELETLQLVDRPNEAQLAILACDKLRIILNATCGAGKTVASMMLLQKLLREGIVDRMIFTLPTRFTSNNLFKDILDKYGVNGDLAGIIHGDAAAFLRENGSEDDENLSWRVHHDSIYSRPITVSTVDHLLMSMYHGFRYADRTFGNIASSLVVFDEIHYYDRSMLNAIGEALKVLNYLGVPHLIMTATIPTVIREEMGAIGNYEFIRVPALIPGTDKPRDPFRVVKWQRPLFRKDGKPSKKLIDTIVKYRGLRQIVYVNQTERAKELYRSLTSLGLRNICYHAGFISSDRQLKEKAIRELFASSEEVVLITTQIAELSLDLSCDVMYSDMPPVDSKIQRDGRLHRNGFSPRAPDCGCDYCKSHPELKDHVYTLYLAAPYDSERASLPYELDLIERSFNASGARQTFDDANEELDKVYTGKGYLASPKVEEAIGNDLVFGRSPKDNYEDEAFQLRQPKYATISVVPIQFAHIVEADFKEHHNYAVRVPVGIQSMCEQRKGKLVLAGYGGEERIEEVTFYVLDAEYNYEFGLELPRRRRE